MELYYLPEGYIPEHEVEIVGDSGSIKHERVSFLSPFVSKYNVNNRVYLEVFTPANLLKHTTVVFIHGLGLTPKRKKLYIMLPKRLAAMGYKSIFFTLPFHLERTPAGKSSIQWFSDLDDVGTLHFYHQAVVDLKATLNLFSELKDFSLVGVSLGSMITMIALGVEERFRRGVLILGGGNYERILWHSLTKYVIREGYCNSRMCHHFYSKYPKYLQDIKELGSWRMVSCPKMCFLFEPLTFAPFVKEKKIMMINAIFDLVIPRKATIQLWEELQRPEIHWLPAGHGTTLFWGGKIARLIKDFLDKTSE